MTKLAICIASRGLVHSRTIESVEKNLVDKRYYRYFFTHNLGIPDAQNDLVRRALKWGAEWVWFVEEDMLIPDGALAAMLSRADQSKVIAVDYPVGEGRWSTLTIKNGEIHWCGFGCTLVHRDILRNIGDPYFKTDKRVKITNTETLEYEIDGKRPFEYGGQDIFFCIEARGLGYKIEAIEGMTCGHIKMVKEGQKGTNKGAHKFKIMEKIKRFQTYNT